MSYFADNLQTRTKFRLTAKKIQEEEHYLTKHFR